LQHKIPKLIIAGADMVVPALPDAADPEVQVWCDHDGKIFVYGHTVNGVHWMHLPELASFCFGGGADGVTAVAQPTVQEGWILDAYRRIVLPMALQTRGQEVLHASAVLTSQGVVALCATSETGKSTMAFGLSRRGWPLWADDAVAFETLDPGARTIPLPFSIRLLSDAMAFFGQDLMVAHANPSRNGADRIERGPVPLVALLLLGRTQDGSDRPAVQTRRLSPAEAFTGVFAHAYRFAPWDAERKRSTMHHYLELVARVPVFEVLFQPGFKRFPAVLDGIAQLIYLTFGEAK
jgi:hypothetical protein